MEDLGADREFITEEAAKIVDDAVLQVFGLKDNENIPPNIIYAKDKITQWTNQIIDYSLRGLSKLGKPFKYCVTCIIYQNNGAGMIAACGQYNDEQTDGAINHRSQINDINIIVTVFGMLI